MFATPGALLFMGCAYTKTQAEIKDERARLDQPHSPSSQVGRENILHMRLMTCLYIKEGWEFIKYELLESYV